MKHWKKGLLGFALLALLAGLPAPAFGSGSAAGVNLMAINERVLETTDENMPRTVGGVLYVPYTMLSTRVSGINLGVNAMYSTTRRTVLVSDGTQNGVIFDTQANTAQDLDGKPLPVRAMVRNTMVFLPIDWLCQYFGSISCSRITTRFGTLIRVTSGTVILSDQDFVDAAIAGGLLEDSLNHYLSTVDTRPSDAPVLSPPPVSSSAPPPVSSSAPEEGELLLALRCGAEAEDCARTLENFGQRALFLLDPDEPEGQDGLIRRLVGAGHTVGLILTGEDAERCLEQAERGRQVLAAAARYNALVVSAPNLDGTGRSALADTGYAVWSAAVEGNRFSSGAALLQALSTRRVNYVELDGGRGSAALLRGVLNALEQEHFVLLHATAPALSSQQTP